MSAPPYIPIFWGDYIKDTTDLSIDEHGAYFLLMLTAWKQDDCSLPDDDRKLARICRVSPRKWAQIRVAMEEFWTVDGGRWRNGRLSKERVYAEQKSDAARENARKRWGAQTDENKRSAASGRTSDSISDGTPLADQLQPQRTTLETSVSNDADASSGEEPEVQSPAPAKPPPPTAIDVTKVIFDAGIVILAEVGMADRAARSLIGRWRQRFGDGTVLAVLSRCEREGPSQPVEWITKALQAEARKAAGNGNGQTHQRPRDGAVAELERRIAARRAGPDAGEAERSPAGGGREPGQLALGAPEPGRSG